MKKRVTSFIKGVNIAATLKAMKPFKASKRIVKSKGSIFLAVKATSETAKANRIITAKKTSVSL